MWLLFAISLFIIIFILVKRKEHQEEQERQAKDSYSNEPTQPQEKKMQIHSVVTDVVHPEHPSTHQEDMASSSTEAEKSILDESKSEISLNHSQTEMSVFSKHLSLLKLEFELFHEWRLFNSNAAFFWHQDKPLVTVLCLSHFVKGEAKSQNYKEYQFHTESWSWQGDSPKGAASEVKKKLRETFPEQTKK